MEAWGFSQFEVRALLKFHCSVPPWFFNAHDRLQRVSTLETDFPIPRRHRGISMWNAVEYALASTSVVQLSGWWEWECSWVNFWMTSRSVLGKYTQFVGIKILKYIYIYLHLNTIDIVAWTFPLSLAKYHMSFSKMQDFPQKKYSLPLKGICVSVAVCSMNLTYCIPVLNLILNTTMKPPGCKEASVILLQCSFEKIMYSFIQQAIPLQITEESLTRCSSPFGKLHFSPKG